MEEIAANFSYEMIRLSDRIRALHGTASIRALTSITPSAFANWRMTAMKLFMCPATAATWTTCSSRMCSITGLVPPHIAAGINLNFWPAGPIFRRPFFIRRTFKGNKLYSTVFREYLGELFSRGYSVEYFVEGTFTNRPSAGSENWHAVDDHPGDAARRHSSHHAGAHLHWL